MASKLHPADAADIEKIATATHFTIHLRSGPHDKITKRAKTLAKAIKAADAMGKTASGKKPMIYAVTPEKFTVMVPADMIADARKDIADIGDGLTGTEIAKLTAIITGGGFKRSNSKAAAEARFIKVATEAGIANAADVVRGPYDMAEHVIREKLAGKALTIAEVKAMKGGAATEPSQELRQRNRKPAAVAVPTDDEGRPGWIDDDGMLRVFDPEPGSVPPKADPKPTGKRAAVLEAAQRGEIPNAPDFSAPTHARFRGKLAEIVRLVEAGDVAALKAFPINPYSSSPKALDKYRNLAVTALESRYVREAV